MNIKYESGHADQRKRGVEVNAPCTQVKRQADIHRVARNPVDARFHQGRSIVRSHWVDRRFYPEKIYETGKIETHPDYYQQRYDNCLGYAANFGPRQVRGKDPDQQGKNQRYKRWWDFCFKHFHSFKHLYSYKQLLSALFIFTLGFSHDKKFYTDSDEPGHKKKPPPEIADPDNREQK